MKVYSEEIQSLLKSVYESCRDEDASVRERQVRQWRRLKLMWEGFSQIWYSEVAHDWRIWDSTSTGVEDGSQAYYDKPVNVFQAYLQSIIAALSITVPPVKCYPDDADSSLDLLTAKSGDKIAQLVYRHNDVSLLWLHALFIHVTEGMVAYRTYAHKSEEYGTYKEKSYDEQEVEQTIHECSSCGTPFEPEVGEFNPGEVQEMDLCPACNAQMIPNVRQEKFTVTRLIGETDEPKTRICISAYGGLNIRIPNYARTQKECPYLIYSFEQNYVTVVNEFEDLSGNTELKKQMKAMQGQVPDVGYEAYDAWARLSPQYMNEWPENVVTRNEAWLRPETFHFLGPTRQDDIDKLKELFPDGVKVVFINDQYAFACNESLDDNWTIAANPLSDYLHFTPAGAQITSIQEITNDLISLILQTIEHGIGQTFADGAVLDFAAYQETEVTPGGVFPATPKSGKSLNEAFYELKTATLSAEVMPFYQTIQSMGQLVSGALPSLFGGSISGSETASEYSMSRAQATQRLQNTWKWMCTGWRQVFGKVIPLYIKEVTYDERDVTRSKDGNFINNLIRKSEMEGRIGKIELEASENLPITWGQKKDLLMTLLQATSPEVMKIINAPENLTLIHDALGLTDFYVPGEDDIIKQYDEIKECLESEPMPTGDPEMPEVSSVEINKEYDNHAIEFEIVRKWITSETGRIAKVENEPGYRNVLLHGMAHLQTMQLQAMEAQQSAQLEDGAAPNKKPNPKDKEAPITGDSDVQTE